MKTIYYYILFFAFVFLSVSIPLIITSTKSKKYKCNSFGVTLCVEDKTGTYDNIEDCKKSCGKPTPPVKKLCNLKCNPGDCKDATDGCTECINGACGKPSFFTIGESKINGNQYNIYTGNNAFNEAKDACLTDINCQGINSTPGSASIVKNVTGFEPSAGIYATLKTGCDKTSIFTKAQYTFNGNQYHTYNGNNAFDEAKDACLTDINCQGINSVTDSASIVKNLTGIKETVGAYATLKVCDEGHS